MLPLLLSLPLQLLPWKLQLRLWKMQLLSCQLRLLLRELQVPPDALLLLLLMLQLPLSRQQQLLLRGASCQGLHLQLRHLHPLGVFRAQALLRALQWHGGWLCLLAAGPAEAVVPAVLHQVQPVHSAQPWSL